MGELLTFVNAGTTSFSMKTYLKTTGVYIQSIHNYIPFLSQGLINNLVDPINPRVLKRASKPQGGAHFQLGGQIFMIWHTNTRPIRNIFTHFLMLRSSRDVII